MKLYHYTCRDSAARIDEEGYLRPWPQVQLPYAPSLVWLTDMDRPDRELLGLTAHYVGCDRMERCYTVDVPAIPWSDWAAINGIPYGKRLELEAGRAARNWYVWPGRIRIIGAAS